LAVSCDVALQLLGPKCLIINGRLSFAAFSVLVPEAAMNKNHGAMVN
jgi:hypothetical protein